MSRISDIIKEKREEITAEIDGLVRDVADQLHRSRDGVRDEVIDCLREILGGDCDEECQAESSQRAVTLSLSGQMIIDVDGDDDLDAEIDRIRNAAEGFGIEGLEIEENE